MKITKEWLLAHRTTRGSWTKAQAEILGLTYPLKKGWIQLVINREILLSEKLRFEAAKDKTSYSRYEKFVRMINSLDKEERARLKEWLTAH